MYKIPVMSKIAGWIARRLPDRVYAWIWIAAYEALDDHYKSIHELEDDGTESYYHGISAIRIEGLRRQLFRDYLRATIEEDTK